VDRLGLYIGVAAALVGTALMPPPVYGQKTPDSKAPQLRFVFEEQVTLAADIPVGETPRGKRNIVPITGGTFEGPGLRGKIMPGGWDWQLTHPSGCFDLHADYMIQTDDGVIIHVVNQGMVCPNSSGKRDALFTSPAFEAPKGKYDWLNGGVYVGTVEGMKIEGKPAVRIRFFKAYVN
jgi:hypothetical protein